ncbi:MAG: cupin domain-containing protein [Microthrixaceae bacterium]|nr:cupin domain-containing protein [Microthrixaceae bacterium]
MTDIETTQITVRRADEIDEVAPPDPSLPIPSFRTLVGAKEGVGFSVMTYTAPPRFTPPPVLHRHTREHAVVVVISGEISYHTPDGGPFAAPAGSAAILRRGAWFRWENPTEDAAELLFVFNPAGFEQYFADVASELEAAAWDPSALVQVIPALRAAYGDESHPG